MRLCSCNNIFQCIVFILLTHIHLCFLFSINFLSLLHYFIPRAWAWDFMLFPNTLFCFASLLSSTGLKNSHSSSLHSLLILHCSSFVDEWRSFSPSNANFGYSFTIHCFDFLIVLGFIIIFKLSNSLFNCYKQFVVSILNFH